MSLSSSIQQSWGSQALIHFLLFLHERSLPASSASCCFALDGQHWQSSSYPLQCIQTHILLLLFQQRGEISAQESCTSTKSPMSVGVSAKAGILQVFPYYGEEGLEQVCRFLLISQPVQRFVSLLAYYQIQMWARPLPGPSVFGARSHNSHRGTCVCGWISS